MLKGWIVTSLFILFIVNCYEYDLLNQMLDGLKSKTVSPTALNFKEEGFTNFNEFSMAFESDFLFGNEKFNLDSLFDEHQKLNFDKKLKEQGPLSFETKKVVNKQALISPGEDHNIWYQFSYPLIQRGKKDILYGFVLVRTIGPFGESGDETLKLFRLFGGKWVEIHKATVSII